MKYKGKIDYPKVGDEIKIGRYGDTPYKVVSLKYDGFEQGDLVTGYEKGVHVFLGAVVHGNDTYRIALLKRVFSDKLKPIKSGMSTCAIIESAKEFFTKEKKIHEEALNIINEYLED